MTRKKRRHFSDEEKQRLFAEFDQVPNGERSGWLRQHGFNPRNNVFQKMRQRFSAHAHDVPVITMDRTPPKSFFDASTEEKYAMIREYDALPPLEKVGWRKAQGVSD